MSNSEFELAMFLDTKKTEIEGNHEAHETLNARLYLRNFDPVGGINYGSVVEERCDSGVIFFDSLFFREIPCLPDFSDSLRI